MRNHVCNISTANAAASANPKASCQGPHRVGGHHWPTLVPPRLRSLSYTYYCYPRARCDHAGSQILLLGFRTGMIEERARTPMLLYTPPCWACMYMDGRHVLYAHDRPFCSVSRFPIENLAHGTAACLGTGETDPLVHPVQHVRRSYLASGRRRGGGGFWAN